MEFKFKTKKVEILINIPARVLVVIISAISGMMFL